MLEFYYLKTNEYDQLVIIAYLVPRQNCKCETKQLTGREFFNAGIDNDETRRLDHPGE
jgi:hypothetical protein